MRHRRRAACTALWVLACCSAYADEAPGEAPAPPANATADGDWRWEGAVGPVLSYTPDYSGAATRKVSWTPGYYIRYGRISLSNTSGFVTRRRADDIFRGLSLDLKRDDRLRYNVALPQKEQMDYRQIVALKHFTGAIGIGEVLDGDHVPLAAPALQQPRELRHRRRRHGHRSGRRLNHGRLRFGRWSHGR